MADPPRSAPPDTPSVDRPVTDPPHTDPPVTTRPKPIRMDGIALSLYFEGPGAHLSYEAMVDRIADAGAPTVSIVVQWSQTDVTATRIAPHPKETPSDADVRRVIRHAHARGLTVMLFPILWVEKRAIGEWRGTLVPREPDVWWVAYTRFIDHYARMARDEKVQVFSVGSEFASLEGEKARWHRLIAGVRSIFPGHLIYSANWDHYEEVTFWDRLDAIGLTGYYRLTDDPEADLDRLESAWRVLRSRLLAWQALVGRPLVFTELGYPSLDGAAVSPWDYTGDRDIDLEEQRRALEAFSRVWRDEPALAGAFFWNGWGPTDGKNGWYTFWGKPAEAVVEAWFARRAPSPLPTPPSAPPRK